VRLIKGDHEMVKHVHPIPAPGAMPGGNDAIRQRLVQAVLLERLASALRCKPKDICSV
jgi:hypothetical protein